MDLSCRIKSTRLFASAKWIREKTKQIIETDNFSYVENSQSFDYHRFSHIIDRVSTDDEGYYKCVVTFSGYGSQTASYKLQVTGKWFLSIYCLEFCSFVSLVILLCPASVLVLFFSHTCLECLQVLLHAVPGFPFCAISLSITVLFS